MLNRICEQFVHDQRERHRNIVGDRERNGIHHKRPDAIGTARCVGYFLTKLGEVFVELHRSAVVGFIKLLVNGGDRRNPGSSLVELRFRCTRSLGLQMQKARHDQ